MAGQTLGIAVLRKHIDDTVMGIKEINKETDNKYNVELTNSNL